MICEPLPNTGLAANLWLWVFIAIGCLVLGMIILFVSRRRRTGVATSVLVVSLVAAVLTVSPQTPAQAETADCATAENSLTVVQTSTMDGLAPGLAPVAITGRVVNNSADSTHITAVEVEISAVTTSPGARPGTCDASDFLLLDTRMLLERTLDPGAATPFTGASIGFRNKPTNQDACQQAVIHLLYTANPD